MPEVLVSVVQPPHSCHHLMTLWYDFLSQFILTRCIVVHFESNSYAVINKLNIYAIAFLKVGLDPI